MTRDEIMAMTLEQLRIAIAEAIEPKPIYIPHIDFVLFDPKWSEKGAWFCTADYATGDVPMWLPRNYTGDICAALELVEEMNGDGLWQLSNGDGDSIDFRFTRFSTVDKDGFLTVKENIFSSSDTAPLAICRAWLLWKATA